MDPEVWLTFVAALSGGGIGSAITAWVSRRNSRDAAEAERAKIHQALLFKGIEMVAPETGTPTRLQVAIGTALITSSAKIHKLSDEEALLVQSVTKAITQTALEQGRTIEAQGDEVEYVIEEDE